MAAKNGNTKAKGGTAKAVGAIVIKTKKVEANLAGALDELKQRYDVLVAALWGLDSMAEASHLDSDHITPILLYSQEIGSQLDDIVKDANGVSHG